MILEFNGYQLSWVFGQGSSELRAELIRFWSVNGAITDPHEAWRRSFEVACIARNNAGEIVGVSSFYSDRLIQDRLPYWFYRTYIRPDCRIMGLAPRLFHLTFDELSRRHAEEPYAPSGVIVVLENTKLEDPAGLRIVKRCGLERIGSTQQGISVWRRYFPGKLPVCNNTSD